MKRKLSNTEWNAIQTKVDQVLGEEFWQEISEMIPILGPRVDVYETKQDVVVIIELPGLATTDDLLVTLNGFLLTIRGDIPFDYPVSQQELVISERFFGPFTRKIQLPNHLYENSKAVYDNGILTISLKIVEQAQEKMIDIEREKGNEKNG